MSKIKTFAVIDLKAFYSFVECVERGLDPWSTPLLVVDKDRGKNTIVLSVSPYLKGKGIPSRCRLKELPSGIDYVYAVPRMSLYIQKSMEVISILLEFVSEEDLHIYSIDEAFLDLTTYLNYYKLDPVSLVEKILERIKEKTGLCATAGIGENMFLSKIALDVYAKKAKNNISTMSVKDIPDKLWTITPLTKVWGIGERIEAHLKKLGIDNMHSLAHANREFMKKHFGIMGEQLLDLANGIDNTDIREIYIPKDKTLSIGQTLMKDYSKKEVITVIREMVDDLSSRLRKENRLTTLVGLSIIYSSNKGGFARQMSLLKSTDDGDTLFNAIMEIFDKNINDKPIRGVRVSFGKLKSNKNIEQLDLFENINLDINKKMLNQIIDELHSRFGNDSVLRASSLLENSTIKQRHSQIGGHKK